MIRMGREFGYAKLETAVEQALELGCTDVAAIRHLLMTDQLQHAAGETIEIGALAAYERPLPTMTEYDQLLSGSDRGAGMSLEAASIAQHCKALRLAAIGAQFASLAEEASSRTTRICTISKPCSRPRSRTANGARSNCASRKRTCPG